MNFLLISDLHIGKGSFCKTLIPINEQEENKCIDLKLLEHVKKLSETESVDYIFICGDISDNASYEQFSHFDQILNDISEMFSVIPENIFFTLGNHDVDWSILNNYNNASSVPHLKFKNRYASSKNSVFLKKRLGQTSFGCLLNEPYFTCWEDSEIFVISINTASMDGPWDTPNHGNISQETYDVLELKLSELKIEKDTRYKVMMMHHHPINYKNPLKHWKDFSILQSTEDVLELAHKYKFDFLIHGHRHQPFFKSHFNYRFGTQLEILCCGSFSQNLPTYVRDNLSNLAHFIKIDIRDSTNGVLCGSLRNFSFSARYGWAKSNFHSCGIQHEIKFGPNAHREKIKQNMVVALKSGINQKKHLEIGTLIKTNKILKYQDSNLLKELLDEITLENGWKVFGSSFEECVVIDINKEG